MLSTNTVTDPQEVLRNVLEATREGVIVVVGDNLLIEASNSAARAAFSLSDHTLEGFELSGVIPHEEVIDAYRSAIAGKTSDLHLKLKVRGSRRYDVHIGPLELDSRSHAIGYFYDVTQVHRLENIRQEFLSNISHELRTPLTSILAFVETLETGGLEDEENNRHFLSVIRRNGERMKNLIADILELSQIEAGNVSLQPKRICLSRVVDEITTSLSSMAATRDIKLINQIPVGTTVSADPKRLEQMLTNLVDNAVRFNRRGGSVTISGDITDGIYHVHVSDTGEGIAPKELNRVFERFYRIDRSRTREVGGTGLGLAIVKHLARLHGGEVRVESELGTGTRFTIDLPSQDP